MAGLALLHAAYGSDSAFDIYYPSLYTKTSAKSTLNIYQLPI
jgi:hypothetical protein